MQDEDWWGVVVPDGSYMDPPGWRVMRQLLSDSARVHPWDGKDTKMFFRGAATGTL